MNAAVSLHALLRGAGLPVPGGLPELSVTGLTTDSRKAAPGGVFIGLRGSALDGASFAAAAAEKGASALLLEDDVPGAVRSESIAGAVVARFPGLRARTGPLFDAFHGFPSKKLEFHGVTGTNGKSTTVLLMSAILRAAGRKVVSLGTIRYQVGEATLPAGLTTPSTEGLYALLARGAAAGCDAVAMEVSSHALHQDRAAGIRFARAVFTNLTRDHLDFHGNFEEYFAAKKKLFTECLSEDGTGIVNLDSPYGLRLLREWNGRRFTFSREGGAADLAVRSAELTLQGTRLVLSRRDGDFPLTSRLIGTLNVENLLAAAAFGLSLGLTPETIARGVADVTVPGRNEVFPLPNGGFAIVDYAHTPDALERVLQSLRELTPGRLHCLFGCGGDRDRGKRPLMGAIAERLADHVILTDDNPRGEEHGRILDEIRGGMSRPADSRVLADRRKAIREGLAALKKGDCLLVAGKGHEDYQIVGLERRHFSDREEIAAWSESFGAGNAAWN